MPLIQMIRAILWCNEDCDFTDGAIEALCVQIVEEVNNDNFSIYDTQGKMSKYDKKSKIC